MIFTVFAGVRRDEDAQSIESQSTLPLKIRAIKMDVTDPASITGAINQITAEIGDCGLVGVVKQRGHLCDGTD